MRMLLILYLGIMLNIFCLPSLHGNSYPMVNDSIVVNGVCSQAMELNNRAILKKTSSFFQKEQIFQEH